MVICNSYGGSSVFNDFAILSILKKLISFSILLILLLINYSAMAQCAMCKAAPPLLSNSPDRRFGPVGGGQKMAVRKGIGARQVSSA